MPIELNVPLEQLVLVFEHSKNWTEANPLAESVGAYWKVTELTPEPASLVVALSETVPLRTAPGSSSVTLGAVPSAVTVKELAPEVRPALLLAVTLLGSAGSTALLVKL